MKNNIRKNKISLDPPLFDFRGSESSARLPSNYSLPAISVEGSEKFSELYNLDVNLTIRLKSTEITRKQVTLVAGQALFRVLTEGLSIGDWMTLEFLYSYLLGSRTDSLYLKDSKELEISLLLKIVLISGTWLGLEGRVQLPEDVQVLLRSSKWVPNLRTFRSREKLYEFSKFLQVRLVPVDFFLERTKGTNRYSSYCKGYGESSRMGRRQKTRPSAELDGEPIDLEKENSIKFPLQQIGQLLQIIMLETKYSNKRR